MIDKSELLREERFWDEIGGEWLKESNPASLLVGDPRQFLSGSSVAFEYLLGQLGDIRGKRYLDYGCGSGWFSTFLAQRGAFVEGFDISLKLVQLGMKRAAANGVVDHVSLKKMTAEVLDYPDEHFDGVVGISILHHISLDEGGRELFRVLKSGGRALFIEPLGQSKVLDWVRNHLFRIHHGHVRVVDAEHPLTYDNIRSIGSLFRQVEYREFQLLSMIARVTGDGLTRALGLEAADDWILQSCPSLRKFCRLVVIGCMK